MIRRVSKVVANGLNIALHQGIGLDDVDRYITRPVGKYAAICPGIYFGI